MKIFTKLTLCLLLITGFPACEKSDPNTGADCGTGPNTTHYKNVRVNDFTVSEVERQFGKEWFTYDGEEISAKDSLFIRIDPKTKDLYAVNENSFGGFSLINSAYACSPAIYPKTSQKLLDFSIISSNDYDTLHPSGTNLIDLFDTYGNTSSKRLLSIFINQNPQDFLVYSSTLYFNKQPDQSGTHILTFKLVLDDTTFVFTSPTLKLK